MSAIKTENAHRTFYALPLRYELNNKKIRRTSDITARINDGLQESGWWTQSTRQWLYGASLTSHVRYMLGLEKLKKRPIANGKRKKRPSNYMDGKADSKLTTQFYTLSRQGWEALFISSKKQGRTLKVVYGDQPHKEKKNEQLDQNQGVTVLGDIHLHNIELIVFSSGIMIIVLELEILSTAQLTASHLLDMIYRLKLLEKRQAHRVARMVPPTQRHANGDLVSSEGLRPEMAGMAKRAAISAAKRRLFEPFSWRKDIKSSRPPDKNGISYYEYSSAGFTMFELFSLLSVIIRIQSGAEVQWLLNRYLLGYSVYSSFSEPESLTKFVFRLSRLYSENYNPSDEQVMIENNPSVYHPFEHVYHSFSLEGGCCLLIGEEMRKRLWNNAKNNYFFLFMFSIYQRFALLSFAGTLSRFNGILADERIDRRDRAGLRRYRILIAEFYLATPVTLASNVTMYDEVYRYWKNTFKIKELYEEIKTKSEKLDNLIHTDRQRYIDRLGTVFLPIVIWSGLMGVPYLKCLCWEYVIPTLGFSALLAACLIYYRKYR